MRRQPTGRPENVLSLATAEIDRMKAVLARVTDGRHLIIDTGTTGGTDTTPPPEAAAHVLYGSKHTRALRVTDGGGLNINFEQGQAWVGGTFYSIGSGSLAMTDASTNNVFVDTSGAVAFNTTTFPAGSIPLATVVTAGADITSVNDRRSYLLPGAASGGPTNHDLLSATHPDTLAAGVTDGSIVIGNVTPAWSELVISIPAANVRNVLGVDNGELRPSWKTVLDATNPAAIGIAAPGTSLVFSHRDHVHAADAANATYTPAVVVDWDGGVDPGNVDDGLDELAERVKDLEGTPFGAHRFRATRDTTQAMTTGVLTKIVFTVEDYDSASAYDTSTGVFTVPVGGDGVYAIAASAAVSSIANAGTLLFMGIFVNGTEVSRGDRFEAHSAGTYAAVVTDFLDLEVGDEVDIRLFQNDGVNRNLELAAKSNHFAMHRLMIAGDSKTLTTQTGTYTITASDEVVIADASSASFTLTLPVAASNSGKVYWIKKVDATANTVTVDGNGSETIDGGATAVLARQYESITIISDGTEWWII